MQNLHILSLTFKTVSNPMNTDASCYLLKRRRLAGNRRMRWVRRQGPYLNPPLIPFPLKCVRFERFVYFV